MRHLPRRLFTIGSAASLLLSIGAAAMWVRSYFVCDALADGWITPPGTSGTFAQAYSNRGAISVRRFDVAVVGPAPATYAVGDDGMQIIVGPNDHHWTTSDPQPWPSARYRYLLGFDHSDGTLIGQPLPGVRQSERNRGLTFPHWLPMLLGVTLPTAWWHGRRRERARRRAGLCIRCGYDLRAHAPGDRCPECGTPVGRHSCRRSPPRISDIPAV